MMAVGNKKTVRLTPAEYVIEVFGGVRKTARLLGQHASTVVYWKKTRKNPGGAGLIPGHLHTAICDLARQQGIKGVTYKKLHLGAEVPIESRRRRSAA